MQHDPIDDVTEDGPRPLGAFLVPFAPVAPDPRRPEVVEVSVVWGGVLVDTRQFARGRDVTVGEHVTQRLCFAGLDLGVVSGGLAALGRLAAPLGAEVQSVWGADFHASFDGLHRLVRWEGATPIVQVDPSWDGFVEGPGGRCALGRDRHGEVSLRSGETLAVDVAGMVFVVRRVPAGRRVVGGGLGLDRPFAAALSGMGLLGVLFGSAVQAMPPGRDVVTIEDPDRIVALLLQRDEPVTTPKAGPAEGARAKGVEGKVGEKKARMEKAKGEVTPRSERQVAEEAGVLGALARSDLDAVFGGGLSADVAAGVGGLVGPKGTQLGSSGLGSRGGGLGGGGTVDGLGGLGLHGGGRGRDPFGGTGEGLGPKSDGALATSGDPILIGALDKALVDEVVKRHMNQIRYCYQRALVTDPTLGGKVVVKFTIAKDGSVVTSGVKASTLGDEAVASCVSARFLKMQFPTPRGGGVVLVTYPFVFGS